MCGDIGDLNRVLNNSRVEPHSCQVQPENNAGLMRVLFMYNNFTIVGKLMSPSKYLNRTGRIMVLIMFT